MNSILSTNYHVHFQEHSFKVLRNYLKDHFFSKLFLLVDSNTKKLCIPHFLEAMGNDFSYVIIEIEAGEKFKNLDTCLSIWNYLSDNGADRKSLMINLGGGVITDMGGFVASTYKRGIKFINIPTTLLSMVDASVGGKTGIDLGVLKNQIGLFSDPEMVLIDTVFLKSLSDREMNSGLAEIIKYGFTFDEQLWDTIKSLHKIDLKNVNELVHRSIVIKNNVVLKDQKEENLRKILNFGHTIGHAIESYFLENEEKNALTHGEAIAIGMVIELFYSNQLFNFPMEQIDSLKSFVLSFYGKALIERKDFSPIIQLMQYDKKNVSGRVNFVLLSKMEECKIDVQVTENMLIDGIEYYLN